MKQTFLILLFSTMFLTCRAQLITVSDDTIDYNENNSGKYYKDLDGDFDNFLGTWINTTGNLTFKVVLYKTASPVLDPPLDYSKDRIQGKFFIIENINTVNENIICDSEKTYANGYTWTSVINGSSHDGITFGGYAYDNCIANQTDSLGGSLNMTILNPNFNPLEAQWTLTRKGLSIMEDSFFIPTDIVLTKIN